MSTETHKYVKVLPFLRRGLRAPAYFWPGGLRVAVAGCFAWTSLVMPLAQASAQERALSPRSSRYDEFGNSPEDSAYFSPQRLRERMEKMDNWIQGQNARLSYLQGRSDPGASEEYSDQVRRYSVERFLVQGEMKDELEAKRAQTSRQLAQAGGFRFKQFKDGKREWYKNGKVQRVENEKIVQNGRDLRRETLDMTYDARGNLAGYRTETRDETGRVIGTSRWEGVYTEGRRRDARLVSFTENSWDALGNATRLDRTNIQWTSDGKKTLSYTDSETDDYGKITKRDVSDSNYNTDGQLTSYKEVTLSHTGETFTKTWSDGKYEKNAKDEWSLSSYKESVTDANGRRTEREWGQANYDEKGRLTNFTEKNTNTAGKTSTRRWENGRYDDRGQLTGYEEHVTDEKGRTSFRGWDGGRYDENGRVVGYEERTVDADGAAGWRQWKNGDYNAKNELIGFSEKIMDARGELSDHDWFGKDYINGLLAHSFETTTDSRGRITSKNWTGVYGEKDRVASFIETNTDIAGQASTRGQDKMLYDALGRMVSYSETNTDAFGIESSQVWTATGFDEEDRVIGYETREKTTAGEQLRRRSNIVHTASGRIAGYDEEVEVSGANGTPLITKTRWSDAVYGVSGDLLSYHESTTNPAGETSSHQWGGRYDSLGRMVSYVDERTGAAGPPVTVRWSAGSFDAFDHATSLTETMESNGAVRERTWSGTYDKRGLVARSLETVGVSNGQSVTTQLHSATYDTKGRLTDSDTTLLRSDMPDLVSKTKVSSQTYDDAGHVTGGSDVTHLTGRTPVGAIDLTITGGTANGIFLDGKLTGYEQTKIVLGTDDRGQSVHIQDVTAVTLGQHGDRTDVTHHMAFNAQNQLVADKTSTSRQTGTVQDVQGRTLTAQQVTFDNATPDVVTTSQIKNTYGATGDLALSIEDTTDALGVRTVRKTESLSTDAAGRALGSRTTTSHPGMTVTEEVTEQSNMAYDALGRSAGAHEDSATTGPGLFTHSSVDRTVAYDGAGNAAVTRETGDRNGAAFDTTNTIDAFNLSGQATASHEQGWSADGGVTDSRRSAIKYNKYGQADTYVEEGLVGGQYRKNNHTALDRDAFGREIRSLEEGINESGRYRYESRTASFNSVGQATARLETGWKASEGNYMLAQNNIRYDVAGRQLDFDQTKTVESKTVVSHWASKGYDTNGASSGYSETGTVTAGEDAGQAFTEDQSVGATNSRGQVLSYVTIHVKTFTDGSHQTSTVNWSNGVYDSAGRLDGFFEDTRTVTTENDGTSKTARNARERHHTAHGTVSGEPTSDGASALAGFTSGYTETLYKDGDPAKAERVEVTNMVYDKNGLYYDSKTLRGKTDRFKDALRGLSSMLFGTEGPLSKTGQALTRLFDLTEGLMEDVGKWFGNTVEGGRDLLNSLLGLPSGSPTDQKSERISAETLATLTDALRKEIGTSQLQGLPTDMRPAVQSFGAMDEAPLLTRRTATVYDGQGRAVNWKEYSLTPASPTKPIYSEVKVTYKGTSSQLASYDAKTIDGEKVLHTYRDQYTHDAQGREAYREVNFEGDDIELLPAPEGAETTAPQGLTESGVDSGWNALTSLQRTALLDDIYNKKVEVLGKVDFYISDLTEYDATGAIENMFTTHVTRGTELFNLTDKLDLAQETQQAELDTELGIKIENQTRLAAQNELIASLEGKVSQDKKNIGSAQKEVDKQGVVLDEAKSEEKGVVDQIFALEGLFNDLTQKIDAFKGKELSRKKIEPDTDFIRSSAVPKNRSREFRIAGNLRKETVSYEWVKIIRINSLGQFVETALCIETKTLYGPISSNGRGSIVFAPLSSSSKDFWSKDTKTICSINDDKSVLDFLKRNVGPKYNLIPMYSRTPELKTLNSLYSDRVSSNAKILDLKPTLRAKEKKTKIEQTVFDIFSGSLKSLQAQWEADNSLVTNAKTELENLTTALANEKTHKMAEVKAETAQLIQSLASDLGANAVLSAGKTVNFSASDWESLLKGETVNEGGKQWDRASLSANALGKHSLNAEEHMARLAMNVAGQTQTISWKGTMTLSGQVVDGKTSGVLKQIATLAENASSQGPPNETPTIPGLTFNGDGHLSVTPPPTQTQDGFGRLTSQTSKTYSLSRWNGVTAANVVTQTTQAFRYDNLGNVVGYDRMTSEPGKNPTHEILNSAKYDAQGRQRASETSIEDETGTYTIKMTNDGYDANDRPINTQRVKTQGTSVTVSKEIGSPISDEWGHGLFSASENLSTTLDTWTNNTDFNTADGQRSKGYTWNTAFNASGDVTDSFRVTQKASGQEGSHFVFESTHFIYKPASAGLDAGRLATSVSRVLETGRDAKSGATLFKSFTDENTVTKYSDKGKALLQNTVHHENGQTSTTVDDEIRKYDDFGRLTESSTTTTVASGQKTQNHYKATAFDQAGRATAFERSSGHDGITTFEEKVSGAAYDANGNLLGQTSKISEWDEDGKGLKTSIKTEGGNTYNLFGQLTKSNTITTHTDSLGATITDSKETLYAYDLSGRAVKTTVNGQEVKGGAIKPYNSEQEILSWDILGRAARTRNKSTLDGLTTEKISRQDIQYDAKGRVVSSRDLVHKTGEGYSNYTEEGLEVNSADFDSWGRATKYTQTLVDGGLRTTSTVHLTYDADGLVSGQTTNVVETSINALVDHYVERTITQAGMKYDALGNLKDYTKEVKEGDLVSTYKPVLLEYDQFGRPTTALERVTDTTGRDDIVGQVGSKYNSLGQLIESPGQSVTVKGTSNALDNYGNLEKVVAGIKAGAFRVDHDEEGKRLVESLGYQGVWVTQTTEPIGYDEQGRANHTYTVANKVGWGTVDVPETEVLFDQTADRGDGWKYAESLEKRKQELQAKGFEVTGTTFDWSGNTKKHRYCRATLTYIKKMEAVVSTHEESRNDIKVFDALNRPVVQTVSTFMGKNETKNEQFLTYNSKGRVAEINGKITESGKNADGGDLLHIYSQRQSFTYNTLGQSTNETTQTWGDSQAPLKITTSVVGDIKYGAKGERVSWEDATSTNDSTVTEVRRLSGATYDGLGRLSTYNAVSYERIGGADKLKYVDLNVVNSYDNKGRQSRSVSQRSWGDKVDVTVLSAEEAQKAASVADNTGQPGGGVSGLDEGWTSGTAVVVTTYQYGANGTSISGMTVTAHGTGTNTNSEVQAQGIHLEYKQSNIKYDTTGRATSYHLKTTQVEHYESFKQVQKGLRRKVKSAWKTESVTTESDVQVLEFDGFGRQVHTVTTSQRNDVNKSWSQTDTVIKSFDEQGRAKDVKRTTDSRMELPKSSGKLAAKFQKSILGKSLKISLAIAEATTGMPIIKSIGSSWGLSFLGVGAVQLMAGGKNWLGGQRIYSHNVVEQTVAYKADGRVDEEKSKAQTRTLENDSYMQGKNFGDKATMVQDIAVAIVAVVVGIFCPPAGAALFMAYNAMRQGISTHDLGMFGKNSDRGEEGKKNRKRFWTDAAMVAVAWLAAPVKGAQAAQAAKTSLQVAQTANAINQGFQAGTAVHQVSQLSRAIQAVSKFRDAISIAVNYNRGMQILWRVGAQIAVAGINGADKKTFWQVAAVSLVDGAMGAGSAGGSGGTWQQAVFVGGGELVRQVGLNFGNEKQRSTWMITGGAIQGMAGGIKENGAASVSGISYAGSSSMIKSLLLQEYSRNNSGDAASEREGVRRGLVMTAVADLVGTITNKMTNAFQATLQDNKFSMGTLFNAMGSALTTPFKMISQLPQEIMSIGTGLRIATQKLFHRKEEDVLLVPGGSGLWSKSLNLYPLGEWLNEVWQTGSESYGNLVGHNEPGVVRSNLLTERTPLVPMEGGGLRLREGMTYEFGGKTWQGGSQFRQGAAGLEVTAGWVLEPSFEGVKVKAGERIPVRYSLRDGALLGEIDTSLLRPGSQFEVLSPTHVSGMGIVHAGRVGINAAGKPVGFVGTLYSPKGNDEAIYIFNQQGRGVSFGAKLTNEGFIVRVGQLPLVDNNRVDLAGVVLMGKLVDGKATLPMGQARRDIGVKLTGEGTNAVGKVNLRVTPLGLEFEGLVQGMAQWQPVVGGGGSGEGRAIPGGVFTVVSSVGKGYLLSGQIPLTEAGVMPFVPTSEFDIAKGVGLTLGETTYFQNKATDRFQMQGAGEILCPSGALGRNIKLRELNFYGHRGIVAVATWDAEWNLKGVREPGSLLPLSAKVETRIDGSRILRVEGLKGLELEAPMTYQESKTRQASVWGATGVMKWVERTASFMPGGRVAVSVAYDGAVALTPVLARGVGRNVMGAVGLIIQTYGQTTIGEDWEKSGIQGNLLNWFDEGMNAFEGIALRAETLGVAGKRSQSTVVSLKQASAIGVGIHSTLSRLTETAVGVGAMVANPLGLGMASKAEYEAHSGGGNILGDGKRFAVGLWETVTFAQARGDWKEFGPAVAVGSVISNGVAVGLMAYGGYKGMRAVGERTMAAYAERVSGTSGEFKAYNQAQRVLRATTVGGAELTLQGAKMVGFDAVVNKIEGGLRIRQERMLATNLKEAREFGFESRPEVQVVGVKGSNVVAYVNGEGGRIPTMDELGHWADVAKEKGKTLRFGFTKVNFDGFTPEHMNALSAKGLEIFVAPTEGLLRAAERGKSFAEQKKLNYEALEKRKTDLFDESGTQLKDGEKKLGNLKGIKSRMEGMPTYELLGETERNVPGFNGRELARDVLRTEKSAEQARLRAEELRQGLSADPGKQGILRNLGEKIRAGLERLGLVGEKTGEAGGGVESLRERVRANVAAERAKSAAERAKSAAERAKSAAERALTYEIRQVGKENEALVKFRSGLQGEIQLAHEGASSYGRRADALGKLVKKYEQLLIGLEDRIRLLSSDPKIKSAVRPSLDLTPQVDKADPRMKGAVRNWMRNGDGGLNPGYAPHPFDINRPALGNLLRAGDGASLPKLLYAVTGSLEMAQGYMPTPEHPSGIDASRIQPNSRDAQARFLTDQIPVGVEELAAHKKVGRYAVEYEPVYENVRGIDQRTPEGKAKIGGPVPGDNYLLTSVPGHRARMQAINLLIRESVRHPGGVVFSFLGDFDQVLKPTGRIIELTPDQVAAGESKVKAIQGESNISQSGPPAKSLGAAAKTDFADPVTTEYEYIRPAQPKVKPTILTPNQTNLKPRELSVLDQLVLQKNYKKILPEEFLRLEKSLKASDRTERYVNDPATGATNLQVINPNTGAVITINGKGDVLSIHDPTKTPRAQSPPLNKASGPRAGPETKPVTGNPGLRDRVLRNIAESKAAHLASKVDPYFKAEAVVSRKVVARDFYRAAGWSDQRINNHIQGIDFNQPVEISLVKKGTIWTQHGPPNAPTGNYFVEPGTPAKGLGVYPRGTIETTYRAEVDFYALKSKAADITDTWSVKGWNIEVPGGQTQYFVPDTSKLTRIKQ